MTDSRDVAAAVAQTLAETGLPERLLGDFPRLLVRGEPLRPEQQDAFRALGAAAADAGVRLRDLIDLYLSLARRALPHLPAVAAGDAHAVRAAAAEAMRHTEDAVAALAEGYSVARGERARRAESLRREFVDDLLTGATGDASLLLRAGLLGLRMSGRRAVLAVRSERPLADQGPVTAALEQALGARVGAREVLVAARHGVLVCVVPAGGVDLLAEAALERVRALEPDRTWWVAMSGFRAGAEGVRSGWREAGECLGLVDGLGVPSGVVRAADLAGYRLLRRDPAALRELVDEVLAPLAGARGGAEPLVETLLAYFAAGGNVAAAGRALHLSVRATLYRLKRIERITGLALDDPAQRFTLQVAALGTRLANVARYAQGSTG